MGEKNLNIINLNYKISILFSDKYSATDVTFRWKNEAPLTFPRDFADGCRLPRYVVSFTTQSIPYIIYYGESKRYLCKREVALIFI